MSIIDTPVPRLTTFNSEPLQHLEEVILNHVAVIEGWFRKCWLETPPPITSSVDLRHAGFKISPVDTNLFPAGYNNLNEEFLPLCVQAAQAAVFSEHPGCTKILIIPESHTRNKFYLQSLSILRDIFTKAGFVVRIGSVDPGITEPTELLLDNGGCVLLEPIERYESRIKLRDFDPCLVLLNNDLSTGIPSYLAGLSQNIQPPAELGWGARLKSSHFNHFQQVVSEFADFLKIDQWLINPMFKKVVGIDFMAKEGIDTLSEAVDELLTDIKSKYKQTGLKDDPFVVVKADNGTYGMGIMMVHDADQIRNLNRKQRTSMSASKGSVQVSKVIVQEGVPSYETMPDGAVAEPVVYMIGQFVVGGFYRVHKGRGKDENLNAPGMHFEPLAFSQACNVPCDEFTVPENRFYVYGVIARLAALAAAREIAGKEG